MNHYNDMAPNMRKVYHLLQAEKQCDVSEISKRADLSESTVRRLLIDLEKQMLVHRYHGGAYLTEQREAESPALKRVQQYPGEKKRIAQAAANMVQPGECIMLTGGTTIAAMCGYLRAIPNLTVVTDSLLVIQELMFEESVKLISLGGILNVVEQCFEGLLTSTNAQQLRFSKMFHGIKSINPKDGFLTDDVRQVEFYQKCASLAGELFILGAANKFSQEGIVPLFTVGDTDCFITDKGAPQNAVQAIEAQGCRVIIV